MIKILVAGYSGSMGQQVLKLIDETPDFELVAVFALGATENDRQRLGLGEQVKIYNGAEYESGAARAQEDGGSRGTKEYKGETLTKAEKQPEKPVQKNNGGDIRQLLRNDPYQKELLQRYQKDERVYEIAKNRKSYPDKLIETLIQYPETMDFVLGYPERKVWKDKEIDRKSTRLNSSHWS